MSLTSKELNYLVWRYLQESGFDLAAYALEKHSQCSEYEHPANQAIIEKIEPGCLVNLVQKGILYSVAQEESENDDNEPQEQKDGEDIPKPSNSSKYSLYNLLIKEEVSRAEREEKLKDGQDSNKFLLKSEVVANGNDVEMEDVEGEHQTAESNGKKEEEVEAEPIDEKFETRVLEPVIKFEESLVLDWHPATKVFAYGKSNSIAVINAIKENEIAESVTLNHPDVINEKNEINIVSWSPQGNLILTGGANGELRAWSPDGKLKNIANAFTEDFSAGPVQTVVNAANGDIEIADAPHSTPSLISSLIWSESGHLLLSVDCNNQVSLWDGTTLNLIKQIRPPQTTDSGNSIDACWLDDNRFAISTTKFSIKIYSITPSSFSATSDVHTIGYLHGHENPISILKFNSDSKLLASCSDYDYVIKVWSRGSSQEFLDLNVSLNKPEDVKLHASPIVDLYWLQPIEDDSVLLSVSMDGIVNIWNASSGENLKSVELFKNEKNFSLDEPQGEAKKPKELLVFNSAISRNKKYLAIADDFGRVTIWDISQSQYVKSSAKSVLRCLGLYNFHIPEDAKGKENTIGVSDLRWDSESKSVSVSYKGSESVIFNWEDQKEDQ